MSDQPTEGPVDARLGELARRQHGVVSHGQLMDLALPGSTTGDWAKRRRLHRVHRGVYAVGHLALTRNGRFMAAVLAAGEGAALSHFSAAVLWRLIEDPGGRIHITVEGRRRIRGVIVHESPLEGDRVRRERIVVTTVSRT